MEPIKNSSPRGYGRSQVVLYNHVRLRSAHGVLTPNAVRLNPAAGRLRNSDHLRRPAATLGAAEALGTGGGGSRAIEGPNTVLISIIGDGLSLAAIDVGFSGVNGGRDPRFQPSLAGLR